MALRVFPNQGTHEVFVSLSLSVPITQCLIRPEMRLLEALLIGVWVPVMVEISGYAHLWMNQCFERQKNSSILFPPADKALVVAVHAEEC